MLHTKGPLLIACNHPNSFLDAIIIDVLFKQPVYSLARGDAFTGPFVNRILYALKIFPVYRTSEGVENLMDNYRTFESCIHLFKKNGVVLIFSEGLCVNEWKLRSLRKGTARLSYKCKEENIPLQILPAGINYSSFRLFGKNVMINFGTIFQAADFSEGTDGAYYSAFNKKLNEELKPLVFPVQPTDRAKRKSLLFVRVSLLKKILLFLPATAGFFVHAPLYLPVKSITRKKFTDTVHYDSVITGLLFILYPLYLLLITGAVFIFTKSYSAFLLLILLPFAAWSYVQLKKQID